MRDELRKSLRVSLEHRDGGIRLVVRSPHVVQHRFLAAEYVEVHRRFRIRRDAGDYRAPGTTNDVDCLLNGAWFGSAVDCDIHAPLARFRQDLTHRIGLTWI